jgi:hypothetical protein
LEEEIENIKREMLNDLVKVHAQPESVAQDLLTRLAQHF